MSVERLRAEELPPAPDLLPGMPGDGCAACGAPMAADQRYCLACGERRGRPRFSAMPPPPSSAAEAVVADGSSPPPSARWRPSGAGTLIAGVATLLIAMGVGVLIGHDSAGSPARSGAPVQVVTLGAGSGGAAAATPATGHRAHRSASAGRHKAGHSKAPKTVVVHVTPKVSQAAAKAATHVFGSGGNLSHNVTQQQGGSCSGGAGCQNGKFTGNFFGP